MDFTFGKKAETDVSKMKLPDKTSMNLYVREKSKENNLAVVLPVAVVLVILIGIFAKFAVIDRITRLNELQSSVNALNRELDALKEDYADYADVRAEYRRYSTKYLKKDSSIELVSRTEILDMLNTQLLDHGYLNTISIKDNSISISINADSLDDVEIIRDRLEQNELTSQVRVSNVTRPSTGGVTAELSFKVVPKK